MITGDKVVYLDNNATTRVAPEVFEAMEPFLKEFYGNPSSMYTFGGQVGAAVTNARAQVAELLGAEPEEITFTSCGTESDSTAILSALHAYPDKRHIVTTRVEHPAVKSLCDMVETLTGHKYKITRLKVESDGTLDMNAYREALTDDTAIVSVMWANNETGVIFPIPEMAKMAKERGILFHTDAVQAVGKIPINLGELDVDFLFVRSQAACTKRCRRFICEKRDDVYSVSHWWPSGEGKTRRYGKCCFNRRSWQGLYPCYGENGRREHPG